MFNLFFTIKETTFLKKVEGINEDELLLWKLPNIIYPFVVILVSLLCYGMFKPADKFTWNGLFNLLFNGSLAMVALNRMSSLGGNLFKYDKSKEAKANTTTANLRVKIDDYSKMLVLGIAILYIFQVINTPFEFSWWLVVQLMVSSIFIAYSLYLSKYAFLLQERLLDKTFADEIKEGVTEKKNHLSDKYEN